MRVLVTGGRGLLGEAVVAELIRRGHRVTSFQRTTAGHRPGVVQRLGDVTDADAVLTAVAGHDAVVHLAAKVSIVGPWAEFERVNVGGTRNVLDAVAAHGVTRLVHVSSPSVAHAGRPLVGVAAAPADPAAARGHYARSKALAEGLVLADVPAGVHLAVLRPHLVWGPGDEQLVGPIVDRARRHRLFLIDRGAALVDTLYVDNAGSAVAQALERCHLPEVARRPLVVTNGEPRTLAEMIDRIAAAAGAPGPRGSLPYPVAKAAAVGVERVWSALGRTDDPPLTTFLAEQLATAHWFDQRATREALAWAPEVSVDEGFRRLAAWFGSSVARPAATSAPRP